MSCAVTAYRVYRANEGQRCLFWWGSKKLNQTSFNMLSFVYYIQCCLRHIRRGRLITETEILNRSTRQFGISISYLNVNFMCKKNPQTHPEHCKHTASFSCEQQQQQLFCYCDKKKPRDSEQKVSHKSIY